MRVDMHVHTWWSGDAAGSLDQILQFMKEKNLDAVVVTDHDTIALNEILSKPRFIPGIEFSTDRGHVLGLWFYGRYTSKKKIKFEDAVRLIHDVGGLVFVAHPFDGHRSFDMNVFAKLDITDFIDGVEVCNGKAKTNQALVMAKKFAKWHGLLVSAGSDAHFPNEVGLSYVQAKARTLESFRKKFESGDVELCCNRQNLFSIGLSFFKSKLQQNLSLFGRPHD